MKEPAGLLPGSDDQPADVLIPFWTNGQDSTLDVTVVNPLQAGLVVRAFQGGQSAVESAHYAGKVRKHEERCPNEGITFTPLALDTLGGWHPVALATINRLGSQLAKNVGKEEVNLHSPPEAGTGSAFGLNEIIRHHIKNNWGGGANKFLLTPPRGGQ